MSRHKLQIIVDGVAREVAAGATLAAVLADDWTRTSVSGPRRAPLCGMGVCFECRVTVDGMSHHRACQILVREGMEVERDN